MLPREAELWVGVGRQGYRERQQHGLLLRRRPSSGNALHLLLLRLLSGSSGLVPMLCGLWVTERPRLDNVFTLAREHYPRGEFGCLKVGEEYVRPVF